MSGKEILADTNILLYLLQGNNTVAEVLQGKNIYVSFITELELIGFKQITDREERQIQDLLNDCTVLPMNNNVKEQYIQLRKKYSLKLADAIIAATAIASGLPLISADKQFKTVKELTVVNYEM
jgi:predicted nucleic acid-binding protein